MVKNINKSNSESGSVLIILVVIILIIFAAGGFWVWQNLYAKQFNAVELTQPEKKVLALKLNVLEQSARKSQNQQNNPGEIDYRDGKLRPEAYSEKDAKREIYLTERELNSFISDPNIAKNVAVDLSDDQLSVKVLMPLDEELPILGGKTIKLHFGTTLAYRDNNLVVIMNGISIGGVPIPSAWWGGIKNQNLVEYFGGSNGFWNKLSAGISDFRITDGKMYVKLKE